MFTGKEIERWSEQEGGPVLLFSCFGGDKRGQKVSAAGLFGGSNRVQVGLVDLYDGGKSVREQGKSVRDVGLCAGRNERQIGLADGWNGEGRIANADLEAVITGDTRGKDDLLTDLFFGRYSDGGADGDTTEEIVSWLT